jgi:hypothetical protein
MMTTEALNAVVRFTTYFSAILFALTQNTRYLFLLPIVLFVSYVLHELFPHGRKLETFLNANAGETLPTPQNPFMNVQLTEIGDNPDRPDAAPVSRRDVRAKIARAFQQTANIYMDTSDMFDQAQAMRTFHTLQSSQVPNDQDKFLAWLAKGYDDPDTSSAPLARGGKSGAEGYVPARGSFEAGALSSTTARPRGTAPTGDQ